MLRLHQFLYTGNEITLEVKTTNRMTLDIAGFEQRVNPVNGIAKFRLSELLSMLYKDERVPIKGSTRYFIDKSISVEQEIFGEKYVFLRGVSYKTGEKEALDFSFLVSKESLQWYNGYELGAVFCVNDKCQNGWDVINGVCLENCTEIEYDKHHHSYVKLAAVFADLSTPPSESGWKNILGIRYGRYVLDSIGIEEKPVPNNPFYVRWVNDMGGFDYHMFTVSGKDTRGASNDEDSIVEVSSGPVSRTDAVTISELVLSPDIRWYDEKSGQWKRVTASQQSISLVNGKENSETGLSFVIPCEITK